MLAIEWTTELIVIISLLPLVGGALGYLIANRKVGQLQASLLQQMQQLDAAATLTEEHTQLSEKYQSQAIQLAELNARLEAEQSRCNELIKQLEHTKSSHEQDVRQWQELKGEHARLTTSLDERERHFAEQLKQVTESKEALSKEFEVLANKIFEEKSKTFTDSSKNSLDVMLKPFREQIEGFQKRINEVHDASIKGNSDLSSEIKKVLEIGVKMSDEANNLTSALKGDAKQRGAWGEAQLKRTLEMSGLIEDEHYATETNFKDEEGKDKRTDYLIKLPDNKHIIIDSKVSLVDYERSVSAETPEEAAIAMDKHIEAVKKHINNLASKDYTNVVGMDSPSFVLMFMPIEPAYIEALKHNQGLFEYGYNKGIVLVSHTTLIPILRTVSNLWMIEKSNASAREISNKAGEIYNTVCTVAERLESLGGSLKAASVHYNKTVTSLVGQQGLYGKVNRFTQLSTKINKSLPDIQSKEIEHETERLRLVVEEIKDETSTADLIELKTEPKD